MTRAKRIMTIALAGIVVGAWSTIVTIGATMGVVGGKDKVVSWNDLKINWAVAAPLVRRRSRRR